MSMLKGKWGMTDDKMKQEKKRKEVKWEKEGGQGGEVRGGKGEVGEGGWEWGRGQEERGFILRLFVRAASRTTARRENRAPRRVKSDMSDEMQSKNLHSGGRRGVTG